MKIDNSIKLPPSASNSTVQQRPPPERSAVAVNSEPVQFSAVAAQLKAEAEPPIDRARVQEIKQAISEGRFKIVPGAIADRLIASAKESISAQRKA